MQQRKLIISAVILAIWLPFSAQAYAATPSDGTANISVVDLYHGDTVNDWMALRGQVQALYFKASEGTTFIDPKAATFAQNAQAVGLPFGFYHYLWPRGDAAYSAAQADYFYKQVRKYPYSCIPAVDVEESGGLTRTVVSANVRAFAEEFQRLSGQQVMIYSGRNFINTYLDRSLATYQLWIAQYGVTEPGSNNVFAAYTMWQYTDSRRVTGISNKVDSNLATNGIFLGGSSGGGSSDGNVWDTDVYYLDTMPHPWNAVAGANFDVLNRNGSRVGNHQVEVDDHICILGVDFERQLAEVVYPLNTGGYAHGFIHNRQDLLHNRFYMQWKNGSTNEPVYNMSGTRIGTIFPHERATPLYRVGNGTMVLYNTAKGSETKSGVVYYSGKFSF